MQNVTHIARIDRRRLLAFGLAAGFLGLAGCENSGAPQENTTPPVKGGGRARLKMIEEKVDENKAKAAAKSKS